MEKVSKENENKDKKIVISIILVLLLFISVIGITYAVFIFAKEGKRENVINTGSITFSYTETSNGISLTNALPISDNIGKTLDNSGSNGYFDFNVSCKIVGTTAIKYEIYSEEQSVSNPIDSSFVKMYLTDGTSDRPISGYDGEVPTYNMLPTSSIKDGAKRLYYGSFNTTGGQSFRLRMWLSDKYSIPTTSQQFKIKVNVSANN